MRLSVSPVKRALNKAYRKEKVLRAEIESFKAGLAVLLDRIDTEESEENAKNHLRDFLNSKTVEDFDELNELFFDVLAKRPEERPAYLREKFARVPYLNSSLFEISGLEDATIRINSLKDRFTAI